MLRKSAVKLLLKNTVRIKLYGPPLFDDRTTAGSGRGTHRIKVRDTADSLVMSAIALSGAGEYNAPSWLKDKLGCSGESLDKSGKQLSESPTRPLRIGK